MTWLPSTGITSGSHYEFVIDIDVGISARGGSKVLHIRLKLSPRTHSHKTAASKYRQKTLECFTVSIYCQVFSHFDSDLNR
jgi:hypothetical protein